MTITLLNPVSETQAEPSLEIRRAEPGDWDAWDRFVDGFEGASFFHHSAWTRFVEECYGHPQRSFIAWRGDQVEGVLPVSECRGLSGHRKLVSVPYGVYGGAIGTSAAVRDGLLDAAIAEAERSKVSLLELRYEDDPGREFQKSDLYWTFQRELPDTPEGVLAMMPKKARAEARKARKRHGLELTEGHWYTDDLYRMFLANKHSLGSPALPARHFHLLLERMRERIFVHLVRRGSEPLAAVMSFAHRGTLIAYYAGTAPNADRAFSASNFMYMALQEWAVERGFRTFDFCRSRGDSGAFRFKVHQGFEPKQLNYCYHLVGANSIPSFTPSNPKTKLLRQAWTKTPLWFAGLASRRLARYLP